jgi:hypothetical protein
VNIDVMIPMPSVTAKPRIGPDPIQNMIAAVISAVTFESMIAEKARGSQDGLLVGALRTSLVLWLAAFCGG